MKVPLSWLRELVPVEDEFDGLCTVLNNLGLEVEEVLSPTSLQNLVVAEVKELHAIEGAEKVQYVLVDDGSGQGTDNGQYGTRWRGVMCGAFNMSVGDKVPLALPGAALPNGMEIGTRFVASLKISSYGMLCAEDELGLGADHAGVLLLDPGAVPGESVVALLGLDETVLDLAITPNRPDCMGMVGVAREVAAHYGLPLCLPETTPLVGGKVPVAEMATLTIEAPEQCPRYVALAVEDVTVGPGPQWMARRLRACGMRPVNNVVDVTNYVMLERGQPLHAFDLDRLAGSAVLVRPAISGGTITTLDATKRSLSEEDLLICDAERPVAVAGVMGAINSEVEESTTRLLLESAHFTPAGVLHTAKRLGLRTEASARFERGVDPGGCRDVADRAARLLVELAGGVVAPGALDVSFLPAEPRIVPLRAARANSLLGLSLPVKEMTGLLAGIGIDCVSGESTGVQQEKTEDTAAPLLFSVPSWRLDVQREVDLIEEVLRLHGYDNVERTTPTVRGPAGGLSPEQKAFARVREAVLVAGFSEAQTSTFVSRAMYEVMGWDEPLVEVRNPLREEDRYLRSSLLPGLLAAASYNISRQNRTVRLYETGVTTVPTTSLLPQEERRFALVLTGTDRSNTLYFGDRGRPFDVYDMKGAIESVASDLGLEVETLATAPGEGGVPFGLHPARSALVMLGETVAGWLGQLHPRTAERLDLPDATIAAEFAVAPFLTAQLQRTERYMAISLYPPTFFDLAFVVGEDLLVGTLAETLQTAGGALCQSVDLFDVYRGEQVELGKKSVAFEVHFQADDRTLTGEDVKSLVDSMVSRARAVCQAELRS